MKINRRVFLSLILTSLSIISSAQLDSLKEVSQKLPINRARVDSVNNWIRFYGRNNVEVAQEMAHTNALIAAKIDYKFGRYQSVKMLGHGYQKFGQLDSAIHNFIICAEGFADIDSFSHCSACYNSAGVASSLYREDMTEALKFFDLGLAYADSSEDVYMRSRALGNMGNIFRQQGQYDLAEKNFREALMIREKLEDRSGIVFNLNNLFMVEVHRQAFDKAEKWLSQLSAVMDTSDCIDHLNYLTKRGRIFYAKASYQKAIEVYRQALKRGERCPELAQSGVSMYWLAKCHYQLNEYSETIRYGEEALKQQGLLSKMSEQQTRLLLIDAYKSIGNLDSALSNSLRVYNIELDQNEENLQSTLSEKLAQYRVDSIKLAESNKTALEKERRLSQEQLTNSKQLIIEQEKDKNIYLTALLVVTALALILAFYFLRTSIQTKKKIEEQNVLLQASLEEKETLMREIHHRVKNNLQSITSMLQIQKRRTDNLEAKDSIGQSLSRVSTLSNLHSILYQQKDLSNIDSSEYVENVIKKALSAFDSNAEFILKFEDIDLDSDQLLYLGFIINEWITNAIKYSSSHHLKLDINGKIRQGDSTVITLRENGQGYEPDKVSRGFGLNMMESLAKRMGGQLEYEPTLNVTRLTLAP